MSPPDRSSSTQSWRTAADETSWEDELLGIELTELSGLDLDISLTGFSDKELEKLLGESAVPKQRPRRRNRPKTHRSPNQSRSGLK
jgi:hypothetical protein